MCRKVLKCSCCQHIYIDKLQQHTFQKIISVIWMWLTPVFKHWFMVHTVRKICALHFLVELSFILIYFLQSYMYVKFNFKHKWKFLSWMSLASEIEHLFQFVTGAGWDMLHVTWSSRRWGGQIWLISLL